MAAGIADHDHSEATRLRELDDLDALNVLVEPTFQAIAELAAHICRAPIALVNLIGADRQYFKGHVGTTAAHMSRRVEFCPHTLETRQVVEVADALAEPRFRDDPVVAGEPYVRAYLGAPMITSHDVPVGVVCVFDHRPRRWEPSCHRAMATLASCATGLLELRHHHRQAEEVIARLREAEELKNAFLRTVNHELRTPLTSITSYLQLMQDGDLPPATEQQFMQVVTRNSQRLRTLLDELLLLSSLNAQTLAFTPDGEDLVTITRAAVDDIAETACAGGQTLTLHAPVRAPIHADAGRLQHALWQVLDNAVKFTPPGGSIDVTVTVDPAPAVEVRDNGIGIEPDDLQRVFDDFYRTRTAEDQGIGGTGVGLPIVEKIMRIHGGSVHIDSRPGEGTRVRLALPAPAPAPAGEREPGH
ncbi:GAF domain-containing sensor histidine kinase [Planomonospora sp. ID67723]|uniref:GAF domain-containing sensor histidine kinase n=1 Tax=Planomonospora sp. ID67723 TaxID=2738134 RepID=UPI0018C356EA|nr:GAF domain-containing sensor histidine kinase [Planomonospora sp. ID67723]MBG0831388.1 GAF domain-containing sensor histidine kinase [Planomonospora sp. ID67723]